MADPPRDANGRVLPHDDPDILPDDGLLRWIDPQHHVIWDDNRGCYRLASSAFSETSILNGGMSISVDRLMVEAGLDPESQIAKDWGIVCLITREMRQRRYKVGSDPLPDNPAHGNVWRAKPKPGGKLKIDPNEINWVKLPANMR